MSTAFRNFIVTFALAAALFGVVGYVALGGIFNGIFAGGGDTSDVSYDYSYGDVEYYCNVENNSASNSEDVSDDTEADVGKAYAVFCEDQNGELLYAKLIFINQENGNIISEDLPLNSKTLVNGYNSTVKEVYLSNGYDYLCGKLGYIFGINFSGFMVFSPESLEKMFLNTDICTDYGIAVKCTVPFEIKYDKPGHEDYNKDHPEDAQMETIAGNYQITYKSGDKTILAPNAKKFFDNIPSDEENADAVSALYKEIFNSLSTKIFTNQSLRANSKDVEKLFGTLKKCTVEKADFEIIFNGYGAEAVSFPALKQYEGKDLRWETLPDELRKLLEA